MFSATVGRYVNRHYCRPSLFQNGKQRRRSIYYGYNLLLSWKRMCVTYFCQTEICQKGGYFLVLANNRDEVWDRPTQKAHFWGPDNSCYSATDETPGKKGGTWLGVSKTGRAAVLVNIMAQNDPSLRGRGSLVSNFISSDIDINDYAQTVEEEKEGYSGFNLVLFDYGKRDELGVCKPVCVSNASMYPGIVNQRSLPSNTFLSLSNSPMEYAFQKVEQGRPKFGQIISRYSSVAQKDYLIDNLFDFLSNRKSYLPDAILERVGALDGKSPTTIQQYSAVNVHSPQTRYGSRTSTVLLIDSVGNVDFVEKDFDFTASPDQPIVTLNHKTFKLPPLTDVNRNAL